MTAIQTRQIVDTLQAWISGSALADTLVPHTEQLIAQLTASKAAPARACQDVDTTDMTEAELFAHFKRISLREDVQFFLAQTHGNQTEALALLAQLETRKATTADKTQYRHILDNWRRASMTFSAEQKTDNATIYYAGEQPIQCPCIVKSCTRPKTIKGKRAA